MAKAASTRAAAGIAARDAALAGRDSFGQRASRLPCCRRPSAYRCARRLPRSRRLSKALGVDLPQTPKTSATKDGRTRAVARPGRVAGHRRGGQGSARRLRRASRRCTRRSASRTAMSPSRSPGRRQRRPINAGCPQDLSLDGVPGRRLLAHHPRQDRDRAAAHGGRWLPRRMLAVVLGLCLDVPDGSRQGRRSIGSLPPLNAAVENLQRECSRRPSDGWSNAVRAIAVSCASPGRMPH